VQPGRGNVTGLASRTVETAGGMDAATGSMLDHWADLITGAAREQEGTTLREGMYAVAVTQAMVEAAKSGRRVPLAEVLR
jgi:predicted dehydrogenase